MRFFSSFVFALVSLVLSTLARHNSDDFLRKPHAHRSSGILSTNITVGDEGKVLKKRFGPDARFSFYKPGLGACGQVNGRNDFIVALNQEQYGNGENCFKAITITYKGKSTQATIMDKCMECPYAALDFSPGLFDFFGPESAGYLYGSWEFGSGEPKTTSTPKPDPTTTKAKPTTTWTPEPTTRSTTTEKTSTLSTSSTSISTHSSKASSSAASSTTKASSSTSTSTSTAPSSTAIAVPTNVLGQLDLVMSNLGAILIGGLLNGAGGQ